MDAVEFPAGQLVRARAEPIVITPACVHILMPDDGGDAKALAEALDGWRGLAAKELPDGRVAVALS